ncbi:hypothetical protein REMIM1_PE00313 (plasmid) [Rhizobium etli bv. mimosae str. Mim1]|nr:hypothetical protein REMIM1_PE00313 [Rhizobium etli bv. mimosae str. Mim1]
MPQSKVAAALSHATASLYLPRVLQWDRCVGARSLKPQWPSVRLVWAMGAAPSLEIKRRSSRPVGGGCGIGGENSSTVKSKKR